MNSLGIDKPESETRVVVAMSGGVDSSVVAALLHEEGYDVIGVTLQLYDMGTGAGEAVKTKTCCAGQDIYDAKRVAEKCGFPHYVLNYESKFRESVIDDFADSYIKGQTPIPCVRCNQSVKFRDLLEVAHDLGADCMATGHYIKRTINEDGLAELHRAHDHGKDQSYFLFATTQDQLDFLRFPLGGQSKDKTRQDAQRLGLLTADKPDSQDICFVPHGDYAKVVTKIRPEAQRPGDIVDMNGKVLGHHTGIIHYTIGQRKGLGIGGGVSEDNSPFYVIEINPKTNQIIVGPKEALARNIVYLEDCNWLINTKNLKAEKGCPFLPVTVKFRSVMKPVPAILHTEKNEIRLDQPQYGIAPGQAAVCYCQDRVLGGGWITGTANSTLKEAA
ncbi:MAG: tRNA 2-thiouridine(34) synthase MnmA [Alphaproteobacteria bacterium]